MNQIVLAALGKYDGPGDDDGNIERFDLYTFGIHFNVISKICPRLHILQNIPSLWYFTSTCLNGLFLYLILLYYMGRGMGRGI